VHRVGQLVAHVRARVGSDEVAFARRVLAPPAYALFDAMPVADRRHALDVAGRLVAAGTDDRDLLAAALLHDAAKGERMRLWHRVGGVLLDAVAPALLRRLANADPRSRLHGFHLYLHHGPMSADLADRAGCPARVGAFIRGSVEPADARLLAALREADDAS
jgi:type IV secretory pathway TrbD component